MKYLVFDTKASLRMEYNVPKGSKYSTALATIKGYEKNNIQVQIVEEETGEVITRRECEFMLK